MVVQTVSTWKHMICGVCSAPIQRPSLLCSEGLRNTHPAPYKHTQRGISASSEVWSYHTCFTPHNWLMSQHKFHIPQNAVVSLYLTRILHKPIVFNLPKNVSVSQKCVLNIFSKQIHTLPWRKISSPLQTGENGLKNPETWDRREWQTKSLQSTERAQDHPITSDSFPSSSAKTYR